MTWLIFKTQSLDSGKFRKSKNLPGNGCTKNWSGEDPPIVVEEDLEDIFV